MIIQRKRGFYVVIKPPGKPHVVLGGPYDKELAKLKDKPLTQDYIDLHKDIDRILDK